MVESTIDEVHSNIICSVLMGMPNDFYFTIFDEVQYYQIFWMFGVALYSCINQSFDSINMKFNIEVHEQ